MFPFGFLAFIVTFVCFTEDRCEGFCQAWAELFVVGDVEPGAERLVRQAALGGDRAQLPAVGRGGVLDMAAQLRGRTFDMAEVHRFTDPGYASWA